MFPRPERRLLTSRAAMRPLAVLVLLVAAASGQARADVVTDWNLQALRVPFAVGPPQARVLAMVHVAMHDAINSVTRRYEPYAIVVPSSPHASPIAAGAAAAHAILVNLFPAMASAYDEALTASLSVVPEPDRSLGAAVGVQAAAHILALRAADGFSSPASYAPGSGPGVWVPTPPAFAPALLPGLGRVVPFALQRGDQFRPNGPPALTSDRYAADVNEVKAIGAIDSEAFGRRTPAQSATARFWLGNMIPIMQQIARQMSDSRQLDLADDARFFALLNIAGMDAYIATWDAKYAYNFWRPITAIRNADLDGNPLTVADAGWTPLGITPPFPDYVSGHTAYTRACVRVLDQLFGRAGTTFVVMNPNVPPDERVRTYTSFRQLSEEMIEARVLAGIHFRSADRDGDRLGRQVARFAIKNVLRPARTHGTGDRR
jgi:hypothetical protein